MSLVTLFDLHGVCFARSYIARVSFRRVPALIVFLPFLNFRIAHSATLDLRESSFVENCFA